VLVLNDLHASPPRGLGSVNFVMDMSREPESPARLLPAPTGRGLHSSSFQLNLSRF